MGIGQVLTMPLFFASNAIYPVSTHARLAEGDRAGNPLTYEVDALRTLMLSGGASRSRGLAVDSAVMVGSDGAARGHRRPALPQRGDVRESALDSAVVSRSTYPPVVG